MPFGMLGRHGPIMRQVVGNDDCLTCREILRVDMGRPTVTNGEHNFVA